MKTDFSQPQPTAGPRYPRIRVSHDDPYRNRPASDYLHEFELVMTHAFAAAFRQADRRGTL